MLRVCNSYIFSSGRPTGPPPSYPPPPVPTAIQHHQDSGAGLHKCTPPPLPPLHRMPTCAMPRKLPSITSSITPSILKDPNKGPPPPFPFPPHLHKSMSFTPPPPPPPNAKRPLQGRVTSFWGTDKTDQRNLPAVSIQSPATLPFCNLLETSMVLNGPAKSPYNARGSQSMDNFHPRSKASPSTFHSTNTGASALRSVKSPGHTSPGHPPPPGPPPLAPAVKTGLHNKPGIPKPPPPATKPQHLAKAKQQRSPLQ